MMRLRVRPGARRLLAFLAFCAASVFLLKMFVLESVRIAGVSMEPTLHDGELVLVDRLSFKLREPHRGEAVLSGSPCEPHRRQVKRIVAIPGDTVEIRCNTVYVNGSPVRSANLGAAPCLGRKNSVSPVNCAKALQTQENRSYEVLLGDETLDFPHAAMDFSCNPWEVGVDRLPRQDPQTAKIPGAAPARCEPFEHLLVPRGYVFLLGDNRFASHDSRHFGPVPQAFLMGRSMLVLRPGTGRWRFVH
jgi:signal peptidase I